MYLLLLEHEFVSTVSESVTTKKVFIKKIRTPIFLKEQYRQILKAMI